MMLISISPIIFHVILNGDLLIHITKNQSFTPSLTCQILRVDVIDVRSNTRFVFIASETPHWYIAGDGELNYLVMAIDRGGDLLILR